MLWLYVDMNSNQLTSLGISLWPTAQEATVGPSKSFLDLSWRPIKYPKHVSLHTKTRVHSFHTHISQPDFESSNFWSSFYPSAEKTDFSVRAIINK